MSDQPPSTQAHSIESRGSDKLDASSDSPTMADPADDELKVPQQPVSDVNSKEPTLADHSTPEKQKLPDDGKKYLTGLKLFLVFVLVLSSPLAIS